MFYSYSKSPKKFSFTLVSALALNLALCGAPAAAMDAPPSEMTAEQLLAYGRQYGSGRNKNLKKAVEFLELAAEKGSVEACNQLAMYYDVGWDGIPADPEKSERFSLLAAQKGNVDNWRYQINRFYTGGRPNNLEKVEKYAQMALEEGYTEFCERLANFYKDDQGDIEKAIKFYELAAQKGDGISLSSLFNLYYSGQFRDLDKAEKYALLANKKGHFVPLELVVEEYCYGGLSNNHALDFNKVENLCFQGAKKKGARFYSYLTYIYAKGWDGHPANPEKAEKYERLSFENKDVSRKTLSEVYFWIATDYNESSNGEESDKQKAVEFYELSAQKGHPKARTSIADLYRSMAYPFKHAGDLDTAAKYFLLAKKYGATDDFGSFLEGYARRARKYFWAELGKDLEKAVHYSTKYIKLANELGRDCKKEGAGEDCMKELKNLLLPSVKSEATYQPVPPCILTVKTQDTTEQWKIAFSWLEPMGAKMVWKATEYSQEGFMQTNARKSYKPEGQAHYENFSKTLYNASLLLPDALKEEAFVFMTPKPDVWAHLLKNFKPYDPLNPTSSEEVGIRLYNLCGGIVAFGNENVKLADKMAGAHILDGDTSLPALITHHQNKVCLLEKLKNKTTVPLDDETRKLEGCILSKPARPYQFGEVNDPKPAFSNFLLNTLQKTYGVKEKDAREAIAKKMKGEPISPLIDLNIEAEMKNHIDHKIAKREEKIAILQAIVNRLEDVRPQRVARFKKDYPLLEDMFN